MLKYIFTKDSFFSTYVPPGSGMPTRRVDFKKGDIIDGTFVHIETESEADFVETQTPSGKVRIPFGGRADSVITAYNETGVPANNDSDIIKSNTKSTNFFNAKNIIIGVLIIGAIFGLLKLRKVI